MSERSLLELIPAIYRLRDADPVGGDGTLATLLGIIDDGGTEIEAELAQRYADLFIETCSDAELTHFAALLGVRELAGYRPARALIANIIGFRRGKGTIATLEQVAAAAGGWTTHAVEYFGLLATTQQVNHVRPNARAIASVRDPYANRWVGTAFDPADHTADVGSIASGRGRYNLPNVGVHVWRLESASTLVPTDAVAVDGRRFRFHPPGLDQPLFSRGAVAAGPRSGRAQPQNVPQPLRIVDLLPPRLDLYYGTGATDSLCVYIDGEPVPSTDVAVSNLGDLATGWGNVPPPMRLAIDPERGRLAFDAAPVGRVQVRFCRAWPMPIGSRDTRPDSDPPPTITVQADGSGEATTLEAALAALPDGSGVIEIADGAAYAPTGSLAISGPVTIRSASGSWPRLDISSAQFTPAEGGSLTLDGLLLTGGPLRVTGRPAAITLAYITLVPGQDLQPDGTPVRPDGPSVLLDLDLDAGTAVSFDHCVSGPIRVAGAAVTVTLADSIVATPDSAPGSARPQAVLVGAPLVPFPALPAGPLALRLHVGVSADLDVVLAGAPPTTVQEAADALRMGMDALRIVAPGAAGPSIDPGSLTVWVRDDRLVVVGPGVEPVTAGELDGGTLAGALALTGAAGAHSAWSLIGDAVATLPAAPGPLEIEFGPPGPDPSAVAVTLAPAPASLDDLAADLQSALRAGPDPAAVVFVDDNRLRVVPGADGAAVRFVDTAPVRALGLHAPTPALAASPDGLLPAPPLTGARSTILGDVHVHDVNLSDSIVTGALVADRRQNGCIRYSWLGAGAQTPRRFHSLGADNDDPPPQFVSTVFGGPGFAQQSAACPSSIAQGANDDAEMGAFHDVQQPLRLAAIRSLFDEYLRFTAEGGVFLES